MDLSFLPTLNAALNACAAVLLVTGRRLVLHGKVDSHRRVMISAFVVSSLFLFFYVLHKASKNFENTIFAAEGPARVAYLMLLFTHVTLAITVPPLAIRLIYLGLQERIDQHRWLARRAWWVWMYVSVTGVVIYVLLYHLNPGGH